jgi:hypothetical protein
MSAGISALPVDMKGFKSLVCSISPDISICVRGRHAIGKSEGVYQAAEEIRSDFYKDPKNQARYGWEYDQGMPVIERRLSQMTEGDTIGIPFQKGEDEFDEATGRRLAYASTQFRACDWLVEACVRPVVLFLDERNRALEGVKQAVFQLLDSKAFYGYELHPETRVVVAENVGDEYQVQSCDPAEISRCATVTLEPSVKEWLAYASTKCHQATTEFIRQNEAKLEHRGAFQPNQKYPDRRSWIKLDAELRRLDLFEETENPLFRVFAGSMLGVEVGTAFHTFCKERERHVSAKDIIKNWETAKKRLSNPTLGISNEQYVECSSKLGELLTKHDLSEDEAGQVSAFMHDAPPEVAMNTFSLLSRHSEGKNLIRVHKYTKDLVLRLAQCQNADGSSAATADNKAPEEVEGKPSSPDKLATGTSRGARK